MTLLKAIETAQMHTKGDPAGAEFFLMKRGDGKAEKDLVVTVYTLAGDKLQRVVVDAKTNQIRSAEDMKMMVDPYELQGAGGTLGKMSEQMKTPSEKKHDQDQKE